jgi:hypothetical protein
MVLTIGLCRSDIERRSIGQQNYGNSYCIIQKRFPASLELRKAKTEIIYYFWQLGYNKHVKKSLCVEERVNGIIASNSVLYFRYHPG